MFAIEKFHRRLAALLSLSVFALAGCASKPEAVSIKTDLGAPRSLSASTSAAGLVVTIDGIAVDALPEGKPFTAIASLITGPANEPVSGAAASDHLVLIDAAAVPPVGKEPGAPTALSSARLAIPAGWTGTARLVGPPSETSDDTLRFRLEITAKDSKQRPVLWIDSHGEGADEDFRGQPKQVAQSLKLEWPLPDPVGAIAIGVGAGPLLGTTRASIWRITIADAADDAEAQKEIQSAIKAAMAKSADSRWAKAAKSLRSRSADPEAQRGTLTIGALSLNADLSAEVATLAEPTDVGPISDAIATGLEALPLEADGDAAAWAADRSTMAWLAAQRTKGKLSKPLAVTLAARYGEVGRDPASLADLAAKSSSGADFKKRLIAEHLILLDDLAPGTRVRAYDWLVSERSGPPGFDPLGPAKDRRAAVDKYVESLDSKAP
jgi:hypothetical protein